MAQQFGWGIIDEGWRKGPWTAEEDCKLIEYVKLHGEGRWNSVSSLAGLKRNGKSCRLRWVNYLRPDLKKGQITPQEEKIIVELHGRWGNRWSTIARSLPGRTDNEIKNYWRTHFKKKAKSSESITEKSIARLLRKQQFHQQQQLYQQQLQLQNQFDMIKITPAFDESENRPPQAPLAMQNIVTEPPFSADQHHGGFSYSLINSGYTPVPEVSNDGNLWGQHIWKAQRAQTSSSSASTAIHYNKVVSSPSTSGRPPIISASSTPTKDDPTKQHQRKIVVKLALHATGNISATFPYDSVVVGAFRNIPKSTWNNQERLWTFPVSSLASAEKILSDVSSPSIEVNYLDPLVRRALVAASRVPDLRDRYNQIPDDVETKLLPFQRDGVRFILQHGGRVLLADEMGLGKTLQAIAVASCIRESWPVLILSPSSLRLHWASMIQQWLRLEPSDILVVLSQSSGSNRNGFNIVSSNTKKAIRLDGMFNIISYDAVTKLQDTLMSSNFKVVVADESHFLKNAQAKRTNASVPILQKAQYVILLSGTPALSRPIELFKQLEALYPDVYKKVKEYGERYCKGGVFGVYQGASNLEELHNLIKATVMIRRLKKDVLKELPLKRRQQVFLDVGEKEMRTINALFRELEIIKKNVKLSQSKEEAESLKFKEKHLINKIYTESAEAKIPAVLDYLGTVIEAGCKFLIFAHHQPMVEAIHQFLLKKKVGCIRIDGSTNAAVRQSLVADFQEKESILAGLLSIKAGGVGLTLTAASTVIFAELSWTPGDLIQAEDRAHRIGQVSSVNVYYLLANDTVDDIIWDVVQSKLENLGQVLDGHERSMEVADNPPIPSPSKQRTLDSFVKRCNTSTESDPKLKYPRY